MQSQLTVAGNIIAFLGENTEKYITFTEVTRIDKNGDEITKNICYILQFFDSASFMVSLLSNLVNNLSEGIHRIKCNSNMMIKIV